VDTRNGIIPGKVSRMNPAVINGTRVVDVKLIGALRGRGAGPELDGNRRAGESEHVVYVGRQCSAAEQYCESVKVDPDGRAPRGFRQLGRSSSIRRGPGRIEGRDKVILSICGLGRP